MAQDYDNMGKILWTDHGVDLSRFVLDEEDVEVLEDLDTEQQTVIARQTDITKRVRLNNQEAILHVELQLRESTQKPMWARNAQYQGYLVGEYQIPVYSNVIYFIRLLAEMIRVNMNIVGVVINTHSAIR